MPGRLVAGTALCGRDADAAAYLTPASEEVFCHFRRRLETGIVRPRPWSIMERVMLVPGSIKVENAETVGGQ